MIRLFLNTLISSCRSLASGDSGMDQTSCRYDESISAQCNLLGLSHRALTESVLAGLALCGVVGTLPPSATNVLLEKVGYPLHSKTTQRLIPQGLSKSMHVHCTLNINQLMHN